MVALAQNRNTARAEGDTLVIGVAAATLIYGGSIVCYNATGFATKGAVATTLKQVGRAEEQVDNTAGANGAKTITVKTGTFRWANSAAGDLIAATEVGSDCFIVDDQTVAKTNGGATRSRAGKVVNVDAQGVWVKMGPEF